MACVPVTISHTSPSHSSTHHSLWCTSCTKWPQELSTWQESHLLWVCSSSLHPCHGTCQSRQSLWGIQKLKVWLTFNLYDVYKITDITDSAVQLEGRQFSVMSWNNDVLLWHHAYITSYSIHNIGFTLWHHLRTPKILEAVGREKGNYGMIQVVNGFIAHHASDMHWSRGASVLPYFVYSLVKLSMILGVYLL